MFVIIGIASVASMISILGLLLCVTLVDGFPSIRDTESINDIIEQFIKFFAIMTLSSIIFVVGGAVYLAIESLF